MTRSSPIARVLLTLALGFAAATMVSAPGCTSSGRQAASPRVTPSAPTPAQLEGLPVCRILTPWGGLGSGVPLSDDTLITCRHCLPRARGGSDDGGRTPLRIDIDGTRRTFELLAAGQSRDGKDDWAVIRVSPPGLPPAAAIDPSRRLRDGEPVYLCGYWPGEGRRPDRDELRSLEPRVIRATSVTVQGTGKLPSDITIFAQVGPADIFRGMSGGPAAVWDSAKQRLVVVGIYLGTTEFESGQPEHVGRVQVIRRIPAEALAAKATP